jgi:hypothetical protein
VTCAGRESKARYHCRQQKNKTKYRSNGEENYPSIMKALLVTGPKSLHLQCSITPPKSVQKSAPPVAHVRNHFTVIVPLDTSNIVVSANRNMLFGDLVWLWSWWDHERILAWSSLVSFLTPLSNSIYWLRHALHSFSFTQ